MASSQYCCAPTDKSASLGKLFHPELQAAIPNAIFRSLEVAREIEMRLVFLYAIACVVYVVKIAVGFCSYAMRCTSKSTFLFAIPQQRKKTVNLYPSSFLREHLEMRERKESCWIY